MGESEAGAAGAAAPGGREEAAFAALAARHRRELHLHCYRMLGSFEEAEDMVREALLRAWRARAAGAEAGPGFRAWLYRIATNACLDSLRRSARRPRALASLADVPWLQPYPDRLLDQVAPWAHRPEAAAVARETVELAFLAAIQLLPPRQRAALIVRDVLGWSAAEAAALLETTVPAANSALRRARATLAARLPERSAAGRPPAPTAQERALLASFIAAHERSDARAMAALMRADVRSTMPPHPLLLDGLAALAPVFEQGVGARAPGDWRLVATAANRLPAAAGYVRRWGDSEYRAFKLDVLRIDGGAIAEITTFGAGLFRHFGLPPTWPGAAG